MSDFSTATAVLEAIVTEELHQDLIEWLVVLDVCDERFVTEAWTALWHAKEKPQASPLEMAYHARLAHVQRIPQQIGGEVDSVITEGLPALVVGFSQRTSFATFGDEYVAASLKMKLPKTATTCHPRKLPPYAIAAQVFGEETNNIVRPLIKQPLKEIVRETAWKHANVYSLFAVVIALKEMIRFPEIYIDSDIAAADVHVPAIAVWGDKPCIGIIEGGLIETKSVVDAVGLCLLAAEKSVSGAAAVLDVLRGKDTTSALYHAYRVGTEMGVTVCG